MGTPAIASRSGAGGPRRCFQLGHSFHQLGARVKIPSRASFGVDVAVYELGLRFSEAYCRAPLTSERTESDALTLLSMPPEGQGFRHVPRNGVHSLG
jgi:hypothetical protein